MQKKCPKLVLSDWEGPWVIADHAYEIVKRGIPNGDKLFARISEYDDYLAYIRKKEDYEPGDTLSLIVPFLLAYDLTNDFLVNIAKCNANFIQGSFEAIRLLKRFKYPLRIISTSYCQYVRYTTSIAGISPQYTKCTLLQIDKYSKRVKERDKAFVKKKVQYIVSHPVLGISASSKEKDLSPEAIRAVKDLDSFFWKELSETSFKDVMEDIKPLGGHRKLDALREFLEKEGADLCESVVIGDSITDWIMLNETKKMGGLALSFNGNDYAVSNSNLAIISYTSMITPIIIDLFNRDGVSVIEEMANDWSYVTVKNAAQKGRINPTICKAFMNSVDSQRNCFPNIIWITKENMPRAIEESKKVRKLVRGIAVGSLG